MRLHFAAASLAALALQCMPLHAMAQTLPPPPGDMEWHHGDHHGVMAQTVAKLSPAGQATYKRFMESMKMAREQNRPLKDDAQAKIMIAMQARPYNAASLNDAFKEERAVKNAEMQAHQDAQVTALSELSTADRAIVTAAITKMHANMDRIHAQHRLLKKAG